MAARRVSRVPEPVERVEDVDEVAVPMEGVTPEEMELMNWMYMLTRTLTTQPHIRREQNAITLARHHIPEAITDQYRHTRLKLPRFGLVSPLQSSDFVVFPGVVVPGSEVDEETGERVPLLRSDRSIGIFASPTFLSAEAYKRRENRMWWFVVPPTYEWETLAFAFVRSSGWYGAVVVDTDRTAFIEQLLPMFHEYAIPSKGITLLTTFSIVDNKYTNPLKPKVMAAASASARKTETSRQDLLHIGYDTTSPIPGQLVGEYVVDVDLYPLLKRTAEWREMMMGSYVLSTPLKYSGRFATEMLTYRTVDHAYYAERAAVANPQRAMVFALESGSAASKDEYASNYADTIPLSNPETAIWNNNAAIVLREIYTTRFTQDKTAREVLFATRTAHLYVIGQNTSRAPKRIPILEEVRDALMAEVVRVRAGRDVLVYTSRPVESVSGRRRPIVNVPIGTLAGDEVADPSIYGPLEDIQGWREELSLTAPTGEYVYMGQTYTTTQGAYLAARAKVSPDRWSLIEEDTLQDIYMARIRTEATHDNSETTFVRVLRATGNAELWFEGRRSMWLENVRTSMQTLDADDEGGTEEGDEEQDLAELRADDDNTSSDGSCDLESSSPGRVRQRGGELDTD